MTIAALRNVGLIILTAACLSACAADTSTNPGYLDPELPYSRIMISEDDLASALVFDEPRVVRDDEGFVTSVEVTVRAASVSPLRVDYRPLFKDANGLVIQPEAAWRQKELAMRVPERILMRPTARNAKDYEIQFRWAR